MKGGRTERIVGLEVNDQEAPQTVDERGGSEIRWFERGVLLEADSHKVEKSFQLKHEHRCLLRGEEATLSILVPALQLHSKVRMLRVK